MNSRMIQQSKGVCGCGCVGVGVGVWVGWGGVGVGLGGVGVWLGVGGWWCGVGLVTHIKVTQQMFSWWTNPYKQQDISSKRINDDQFSMHRTFTQ